jgi:hypothetical protein
MASAISKMVALTGARNGARSVKEARTVRHSFGFTRLFILTEIYVSLGKKL